MSSLSRFLNPRRIALFGGGWAENVAEQLLKSGFAGDIWPIHPTRKALSGIRCYASIADLPDVPDAAFVGVNRQASIEVIGELSKIGAGGAICFASGFKEAQSGGGEALQQRLLDAAGNMPLLGPNCYGFLNYLDNVCLWPDQHGGLPVQRGVAIVAQSSNVAINMTMQRRGLPISHLITMGNQAQIEVSRIAGELLKDDRVSAIGLYLESFGNLNEFCAMAEQAAAANKPIVVLKVGKSEKGRLATVTHTAALTGGAHAASALLRRLGLIEVSSISHFLEALKLVDQLGQLTSNEMASISCSGGEASLMSDLAEGTQIIYPDFSQHTLNTLATVLGDRVDLANPLDYHTYIWGDTPGMTDCFAAVLNEGLSLTALVLDVPRSDRCDPQGHQCAIDAFIAAHRSTSQPACVISTLPENLAEPIVEEFAAAGIPTLHGMETAIAVIDAVLSVNQCAAERNSEPPLCALLSANPQSVMLDEYKAKLRLKAFGIEVPDGQWFAAKESTFEAKFSGKQVLKTLGLAHKTEQGAIYLGIEQADQLAVALRSMPESASGYLLESMIEDVVCELLVGVTIDATGLVCLTIGAGGVLAELYKDTQTLVMPVSRDNVAAALDKLTVTRILKGYRGKPAANMDAILDAVMKVGEFVEQNLSSIVELDINPLLAGQSKAVAADVLLIERRE